MICLLKQIMEQSTMNIFLLDWAPTAKMSCILAVDLAAEVAAAPGLNLKSNGRPSQFQAVTSGKSRLLLTHQPYLGGIANTTAAFQIVVQSRHKCPQSCAPSSLRFSLLLIQTICSSRGLSTLDCGQSLQWYFLLHLVQSEAGDPLMQPWLSKILTRSRN